MADFLDMPAARAAPVPRVAPDREVESPLSNQRMWHRLKHPDILSWDFAAPLRAVEHNTTLESLDISVRRSTQIDVGDGVIVDGDNATITGYVDGKVSVRVRKPGRKTSLERVVRLDEIECERVTYCWVITTGKYARMCVERYTLLRPDGTEAPPSFTYDAPVVDSEIVAAHIFLRPWVPSHWEHAKMLVDEVAPVLRRANVPSSMLLLFDFFFNPINDGVIAPVVKERRAKALGRPGVVSARAQRCIAVVGAGDGPMLVTRRDGLQVYNRNSDVNSDVKKLTPAFTQGPYPCWEVDSSQGPTAAPEFNVENANALITDRSGAKWYTLAAWKNTATETACVHWNRPKRLLYTLQPREQIHREVATFKVPPKQDARAPVYAKLVEPGYVVLSMLLREIIETQLQTVAAWRVKPMTVGQAYSRAIKWLIGTQENHMRSAGYKLFNMLPAFPIGTVSTVNGIWFLPHATYTIAALHMRYRVVEAPNEANRKTLELFASACPHGYNMATKESLFGMLVPQMTEQVYKLNTGPAVYPRCVRTLFHHLHLLGIDVDAVRGKETIGIILGTWQDAQKRLDNYRSSQSAVVGAWTGKFAVLNDSGEGDSGRAAAAEQQRFQKLVDYTVEVVVSTIEITLMKAAGMTANSDELEADKVASATREVVAASLNDIIAEVSAEGGSGIFASVTAAVSGIISSVTQKVKARFGTIAKFAATAGVLGLRFVRFCLRHPLVSLKLLKFVGDFLGVACDICVDTFKSVLGYDIGTRVVRTRVKNETVARKLTKSTFGCAIAGPNGADAVIYEQLDIDTQKWVELDPVAKAKLWAVDAAYAKASAELVWQGWMAVIEQVNNGKSLYRTGRDLVESGVADGYKAMMGTQRAKEIMYHCGYVSAVLKNLFRLLTSQFDGTGGTLKHMVGTASKLPVVGTAVNALSMGIMSVVNLSTAAGLSVYRIVEEISASAPELMMDTFVTYLEAMNTIKRAKAMWHAVSGPCLRALRQRAVIDGRRLGECESAVPIAFELMMENAPYYALTMLALPNSLDYNTQPFEGQFQWMLRTSFALDKRPARAAGPAAASGDAAAFITTVLSGDKLHARTVRKYWLIGYTNAQNEAREIELAQGSSFLFTILDTVAQTGCDSSAPDKKCWISNPTLHNVVTAALIGLGVAVGTVCTFKLMAAGAAGAAAGAGAKTASTVFTFYHGAKYATDKIIGDKIATQILDAFRLGWPKEAAGLTIGDVKAAVGAGGVGGGIGGLSVKATLALWGEICTAMGGCTWPVAHSLHDVLAVDSSGIRYNTFRSAVTKYYAMFKNKDPQIAKYGSWLDAGRDTTSWVDGGFFDTAAKLEPAYLVPKIFKSESEFDPYVQLNNWLLNIPGVAMYIPLDAKKNFDLETTCAYFTGGFIGKDYRPARSFPVLWTVFTAEAYGSSDVVVTDGTAAPSARFKKGASGPATDSGTAYQATADTPVWVSPDHGIEMMLEAGWRPKMPPTMNPSTSTEPLLNIIKTGDIAPAIKPLKDFSALGELISFKNATPTTYVRAQPRPVVQMPYIPGRDGPGATAQGGEFYPTGTDTRPQPAFDASAEWRGTTALTAPEAAPPLAPGRGPGPGPGPGTTSTQEWDHAFTGFTIPAGQAPPPVDPAAEQTRRVALRTKGATAVAAAGGQPRIESGADPRLTFPTRTPGDGAYDQPEPRERQVFERDGSPGTAVTTVPGRVADIGLGDAIVPRRHYPGQGRGGELAPNAEGGSGFSGPIPTTVAEAQRIANSQAPTGRVYEGPGTALTVAPDQAVNDGSGDAFLPDGSYPQQGPSGEVANQDAYYDFARKGWIDFSGPIPTTVAEARQFANDGAPTRRVNEGDGNPGSAVATVQGEYGGSRDRPPGARFKPSQPNPLAGDTSLALVPGEAGIDRFTDGSETVRVSKVSGFQLPGSQQEPQNPLVGQPPVVFGPYAPNTTPVDVPGVQSRFLDIADGSAQPR